LSGVWQSVFAQPGGSSRQPYHRFFFFLNWPRHAALGGAKSAFRPASLLIASEPIWVFLLSAAAARRWRLNGALLAGILLGFGASVY